MTLAVAIKSNTTLKDIIHRLLIPKHQAKPRKWVSWFVNPFVHKRGKGVTICRRTRMDVLPFQPFSIGDYSTVEDFATINNGVGEVSIGNNTRIGLGNVIIGPVSIGNNVILAQNIVVSGLNHVYEDVQVPISDQPVTMALIRIENNCWIGANALITAGITIGKHSVVAGGAVVTKDVPAYSIVAGNPAKVIKQYNNITKQWERVTTK